MLNKHFIYYLLIALIGMLHGCISDDLDLSKKKTIAISIGGEGLTFSGSNSFDVPLSQLIDVSDDSELTIDSITGDFLFYKRGDDMDSTVISIGQGSICDAVEEYVSASLFSDTCAILSPSKRYPDFASLDFECSVTPKYNADQLKDGIAELIFVNATTAIDIDFAFEGVAGIDNIDEIKFEIPSFYELEDSTELSLKNISISGTHSHHIHIKGLSFDSSRLKDGEYIGITPIWRQISMVGKVQLKGKVKSVNIEEFQSSDNPMLHCRFTMGSLGTTEVTGRFAQREIIDFPPMVFHDLPDFIQDEDVEIDVENPICRLSLNSEVPASVDMNAEIIGIKGGQEISHLRVGTDFKTHPIRFEGAKKGEMRKTNIWLSRVPVENLPDTVDQNIVIPEIADIMRHIPDQFNILLTACTDSTQEVTLSLSEEYKAIPTYELVAPLKLGPNMRIVYTKELERLGPKIKHLDFSSITLTAKVQNHLPLNVNIVAIAYDEEGEELKEVIVETPVLISAFSESEILFSISSPSNEFALKKIDKIRLKIYASSSEELAGISLNKDQNLRMEEVNICIK